MKRDFKGMFTKVLTLLVIVALILPLSGNIFASQETWNKGEKVTYRPSNEAIVYKPSDWTKDLADLYQLKWYESPSRHVLKGEFMLVQLRVIQASLERRGLTTLSADQEILDFKDISTLTAAAQEEAKILKALGILSGTPEGNMAIAIPIKRSEAAKVIAIFNNKVLKIPAIRTPKDFTDTKGHWAERNISIAYQISLLNGVSDKTFNPNQSLTLEQMLQILENEIGYYGIRRVDVAKAMNETFKVTVNTDLSKNATSKNAYVKYEEKMKTYGFDKMYNNQSATTSESVTKAEALKLALSVIFNMDQLDGYSVEDEEYPNAIWVEYAKMMGVTNEDINITNYKDKATYIDAISYFEACKVVLKKDLPVKSAEVYLDDLSMYNEDEQVAIKDMVANEIIYILADTLNGSDYIYKGQLNELVVNYAEKYNTIVANGEKINTDPEKMPLNASLFPYVLSNVDSSVYEKPFFVRDSDDPMTPKEVCVLRKDKLPRVKYIMEEFFNDVLNIDYKTITEKNFKQQVDRFRMTPTAEDSIKKYVKYVKDNEIVIVGSAEFQSPIFYYDGITFRARLNLNFEVINSKTKDNLLFIDFQDTFSKAYEKTKYDFYADYFMTSPLGSYNIYLDNDGLYKGILDKEKCGITKKSVN